MPPTPPPLPAPPAPPAVPLEQRLASLERQLKRQRRIVALCVLALLFLIVLMAATDALARRTRMASFKRVQLVDEQGRLRAVLTAEGDAPRLAFLDHAGGNWAALELGTEKAGPYVSLLENHRHRLAITREQILVRDAE